MPNMLNLFNVKNAIGCADKLDYRAQTVSDKCGIKKMSVEEIMNY